MAAVITEMLVAACSKSPFLNNRLLHHTQRWGSRLTVTHSSFLCQQRRPHSSSTPPNLQKAGLATTAVATETKIAEETDPLSEALRHEDFFDLKSLVTTTDLFSARVHLGHKAGSRNPYMTPYVWGCRQGTDILDLDQTLPRLHAALNVTAHVVYRGGVVLFLTRQSQTLHLVERMAVECGQFSHCRYWKGGTFTNSPVQFRSETRLPDLCVFLHTLNNAFLGHRALTEATKLLIPIVGVVDSNCDPRLITYAVPGNDDSPVAVQLYCRLFKEAVLRATQRRKEDGLEIVY